MFNAGDIIEGEILSLSFGGEAVLKKNGVVFFIERGVPGDIVKIKIKKIKKRYGSAEIIEVIKPSKIRIKPDCLSYEKGCGGCQWLNIHYTDELFWKTKIIRDSFKHIGGVNLEVLQIAGMKSPERYRNKLSVHKNESGKIGLAKKNSHSIIAFSECRMELSSNQKIAQIINTLKIPESVKQLHIRSNLANESGICLYAYSKKGLLDFAKILSEKIPLLKGVGALINNEYQNISGEDSIEENVNKIKYRIHLNGFFQTNYTQAGVLGKTVIDMLKLEGKEEVIDLYCGCGFFTLQIAKNAKFVYGIENGKSSIDNAELNAGINNIDNVKFICKDAKNALSGFKEGSVDAVALDPPRSGCEKKVLEEICRIKPAKIIYVSCSPDTLARDLKILKNYGYSFGKCKPFDMFPHTYHVETVTEINLKS